MNEDTHTTVERTERVFVGLDTQRTLIEGWVCDAPDM